MASRRRLISRDDRSRLLDDILGRRVEVLEQRLDALPADGLDLELLGLHLGQQRRIGHGGVEGLAQSGGAIGRDAGRCREWETKRLGVEHELEYLLLPLAGRELHDGGYVRQLRRALEREHVEELDLLLRDPVRL